MNEGKEGKFFEHVAEAPAKVLDKSMHGTGVVIKGTGDALQKVSTKVSEQKPVQKAKAFWNTLGPGLTTGASDDDPSGITTYSQTGAQFGYSFLWLAAFTFPLMSVVQEMCARIGIVTGRGLAGNIRLHFSKKVLIFCTMLLFAANALNIGANLGAMAEVVRLFWDVNYLLMVVAFASFILLLQIYSAYKNYANILKWLALILLAYVLSALLIEGLDWKEIGRSAVTPSFSFNKDSILLICAILGTTISPFLFFWQTSQEVEAKIEQGMTSVKLRQSEVTGEELRDMRTDVWSGMFLSNLVMFFIIVACAATLNANGITNIDTASQAAEALRPFAGEYSYLLFAIGIIGTGLLGIPVLAGSSSYAIAESFGWKEGLHYKLRQAYSFYGIIILSVLVGIAINFIGIDPIKALIYSAVGNGLVAPVVLVLILLLASNSKVMGRHAIGWAGKSIGWITVTMMAAAGLASIWVMFSNLVTG